MNTLSNDASLKNGIKSGFRAILLTSSLLAISPSTHAIIIGPLITYLPSTPTAQLSYSGIFAGGANTNSAWALCAASIQDTGCHGGSSITYFFRIVAPEGNSEASPYVPITFESTTSISFQAVNVNSSTASAFAAASIGLAWYSGDDFPIQGPGARDDLPGTSNYAHGANWLSADYKGVVEGNGGHLVLNVLAAAKYTQAISLFTGVSANYTDGHKDGFIVASAYADPVIKIDEEFVRQGYSLELGVGFSNTIPEQVPGVPEPSSYALMLAGLATIALRPLCRLAKSETVKTDDSIRQPE